MEKITSKFSARILVVEDYIVNRELVKEMLEMMSCDVDIAEDGEQALTMYSEIPYDIIFMDIQMPKKDGVAVTKEIRDSERSSGKKHIPIIALTANAMHGDKEKYLEAGMDDFISKPLKGIELERVLNKYVGKKS